MSVNTICYWVYRNEFQILITTFITSLFLMSHPSNLNYLNGQLSDLVAAAKKAGGLCVVDFYADFCPPCRRLVGDLPTIASEFPDVQIFKCDVMSNEDLANHFQVGSIPCIKFVKAEGESVKVLDTVVGYNPEGIKNKIRQHK